MNGLQKPKCKAHKKDGTPCGRWPVKGSTVCPKHGGSAPQVRKKAAERLMAAADSLMAQLLKIAASAESESVRLAAIKDALDRAGFQPAQMVKLGLAQDESPYDALLREILRDPDLVIDAPRSALPAPARGWGKEWLPEEDGDTIIGEVIPEPEPTPARPAAPRGKRRVAVKVPGHIRTGLRLDPERNGATFAP